MLLSSLRRRAVAAKRNQYQAGDPRCNDTPVRLGVQDAGMSDGYEPLDEALVRAAQAQDWSLDRLLRFADMGFAPAISLLVGGRWIEGILSTEEDWADRLDADVDAGIGWASARSAAEFGPIDDPTAVP